MPAEDWDGGYALTDLKERPHAALSNQEMASELLRQDPSLSASRQARIQRAAVVPG